ncbi:hypothetical protein IX317_001629 [Fusobacterium sp. DD29]|nr:hypothetical protein [Fusobacterium sp. DD45]MBR8710976.1 hypothetical protein [Fusobacterium sp. DD28]MBR8749949.1 hypothetical protein [Fusobacterium sp. DD29]MBR8751550.1 hypothetical protein [Fusobacterium sp. DD26]MBR8762191.1 hypothetical protein [Fusobacterium sp. DD25]MBR8768208.1 hypothetical protein [Fusobacterium sp. DD43]MBR8772263.1 hypothetical protein [Fusobacterium sp. DD40]MBR8776497.1 hypothetical protein [Fusobacterium sp. DD17]MBR8798766.1 hypothetical protein [Fusoba
MIYIISLLGILIENSLPFNGNIYIITLSFFIYLVNLKQKRNLLYISLISLLLSLQTDYFLRFFVILLVSYGVVTYIFENLSYSKFNIILIAVIQMIMYKLLIIKELQINYLIINFIGCLILNYIYVKISHKTESIRG